MEPWILRSFPSPEALAREAAGRLVSTLENRDPGKMFAVALSGGRIARNFLSALADLTRAETGPFHNVHFFWADERCVPPTDPESNYALARDHLFERTALGPGQVHRIRGELPPQEAASLAARELCATISVGVGEQPALDLVFLGMGEDGHVASLFPGEPDRTTADPAVYRAVRAAKPPPERVTLGYPALAAARELWVLVSGSGKTGALRASLLPEGRTPLARVLKSRQNTELFADCLESA